MKRAVLCFIHFPFAKGEKKLVAVTGADRDALAALGAAARQYGLPSFALHAGPEAMRLGAVAAIRLKCALRHRSALLNRKSYIDSKP